MIGGDQQRSALVAGTDQLEEHADLGLGLGDVGDVIEDQQIEAIEAADGRFESELTAGDLQFAPDPGCA